MKRAFIALLIAAPLCAMADSPDSSFYKKAAEAGNEEVELGKLASEKGTSAGVKEFGAMMVKDHGMAGEKLKAIATTKSVDLPTGAGMGGMATKAKLEVLSGETFDKSYIKGQLKAHHDTMELFNTEIASGQDTEAKAFAKSTLPTVKAHIKALDKLAMAAGVSEK